MLEHPPTMTTPFPQFHETYEVGDRRRPYDGRRHAPYASLVPELLVREWRAHGFGEHAEGAIWTLSPDASYLDPAEWGLHRSAIPILRTAFASHLFWCDEAFVWLNPFTGKATQLGSDPELQFEYTFVDPLFMKDMLRTALFRTARRRLGPLDEDECYGFAPLPALGGAVSAKYLMKTDMREYLSLSASVLERHAPGDP